MAISHPAAQHSWRGRWWHALTAFQPGESGWPSAIRRGGIVGLIAIVGAATGTYAELATVAIGALNIGLVDGAVPKRTLRRALIAVAIAGSIIAGIAALLAGTWWTVPMLVVLAYLLGAFASRGLVAFNLTFMSLLIAVIFTNSPTDLAGAIKICVLVFVGSAIQAVASLLSWRYERESIIRRSIGLAIEEICRSIQSTGNDAMSAKLSAVHFMSKAESDVAGARLAQERNLLYADILNELNWARLCINSWLTVGNPQSAQRDWLIGQLRQVDAQIRSRPAGSHVTSTDDGTGDPTWTAVTAQLGAVQQASQRLHDEKFHFGPDEKSERAGPQSTPMIRRGAIRANLALLKPGSVGFRHALRLSLAVGLAQIVALSAHLDRGYWVPLTVVMVVKPDFTTTFVRGILRIGGTVAAIVVVGGIMVATGGAPWVMALLVVAMAPLAMRWINANYAFGSFAISSTVLLLVEAGDPSAETYVLRLQNTFIGVLIGAISYLVIPSWKTDRVGELLLAAVRTQRDWTLQCLATLNPGRADLAALRESGHRARQAAIEARPVLEAAALEPVHRDINPVAALDVLDACQQAAFAGTAIEVLAHQGNATAVAPDEVIAARLASDYDSTIDALQGGAASKTPGPDDAQVRAAIDQVAQPQLRRSLLLITTSTDTAAAVAPRVTAQPPS